MADTMQYDPHLAPEYIDPADEARPGRMRRNIMVAVIVLLTGIIAASLLVNYKATDPTTAREEAEAKRKATETARAQPGHPDEIAALVKAQSDAVDQKNLEAARTLRAKELRDEEDRLAKQLETKRSANATGVPAVPTLESVEAMRVQQELILQAEAAKRKAEAADSGIRAFEASAADAAAVTNPQADALKDLPEPLRSQLAQQLGQAGRAGSAGVNTAGAASAATGGELNEFQRQLLTQLKTQQDGAKPIPVKTANDDFISRSDRDTPAPIRARAATGVASLVQGTVIPCVLLNGINSDLPGQIIARVTQDIYDSRTGMVLMVPRGTQLFGSYSAEVIVGQKRVLAAFTRMVFPSGATVSLGGSQMVDTIGRSGREADVDNHFFQMFGSAFLIGAIARIFTPSAPAQNVTIVNSSGGSGGLGTTAGQILADTAKRTLDRNQTIKPTLEVGYGEPFNVLVSRDLELPNSLTQVRP